LVFLRLSYKSIINDGMRKKIFLLSLVAGFCYLGILCYKSCILAFVITKYLSGRKDGKQGVVRSIIIPWRNYQLHVHHWVIALIIVGVFAVEGFYILAPEISYGILSAIIFQGIYCYEDWYRIIRRKSVLPTLAEQLSLAAVNDQEF